MRKITPEEAEKMLLKVNNKSPLQVMLLQMKVGDLILVEEKECSNKRGPTEMCSRLKKKTNRKYVVKRIIQSATKGWVIEREK